MSPESTAPHSFLNMYMYICTCICFLQWAANLLPCQKAVSAYFSVRNVWAFWLCSAVFCGLTPKYTVRWFVIFLKQNVTDIIIKWKHHISFPQGLKCHYFARPKVADNDILIIMEWNRLYLYTIRNQSVINIKVYTYMYIYSILIHYILHTHVWWKRFLIQGKIISLASDWSRWQMVGQYPPCIGKMLRVSCLSLHCTHSSLAHAHMIWLSEIIYIFLPVICPK